MRRKKVFARLGELLQRVKKRVLELDPKAEVYLFGSVAEGRSTYSSDNRRASGNG